MLRFFKSGALPERRQPGLDTLRALAISLVFMYHYMVFVSGKPSFGFLSVIGWAGVDLFFVLSGYLIADQLLRGMVAGHNLSLPAFFARRALRTLPLFWLILAAYWIWGQTLGGKTPPPLWRFLSFTQNIGLTTGTAFSHAWSLCIEEQFYLLLPLVLVLGVRLRSRFPTLGRRQGWWLLGLLCLLGVSARCYLWAKYGREDIGDGRAYYTWVYYSTLCRFDEFLPGIALAMLKNLHPELWAKLRRHGWAWLLSGIAACALMFYISYHYYYIEGYGYGFFMTGFGYSLQAWAFALLVMAALAEKNPLQSWQIPGAAQLALYSYAIYLSHKPLAHVLRNQFKTLSHGELMVLITVCCIVVGAALHYLLEAPIMSLRARWVPHHFKREEKGLDLKVAMQK